MVGRLDSAEKWYTEIDRGSEEYIQAQEEFRRYYPVGEVASHVTNISGGGANEEAIYKMAAEVLGNMKGKSPAEMAKILEDAKQNPEAFVNSWTPEQQAKLKELSERMPAAKQAKP
jgi:hypothetical protein